jgi:hypothetical protein
MAQTGGNRPVSDEVRVRDRVDPCGIYGDKLAMGQIFL